MTTTDAPSALFSLEDISNSSRGYKFPGTLKERGEQKVMQSLKLTWVDLLLLYSYLVVVCMTLQAGRALNIHPIYYRVDKITIAYECE